MKVMTDDMFHACWIDNLLRVQACTRAIKGNTSFDRNHACLSGENECH